MTTSSQCQLESNCWTGGSVTAGRRRFIRMSNECQEVQQQHLWYLKWRAVVIGTVTVIAFWLLIVHSQQHKTGNTIHCDTICETTCHAPRSFLPPVHSYIQLMVKKWQVHPTARFLKKSFILSSYIRPPPHLCVTQVKCEQVKGKSAFTLKLSYKVWTDFKIIPESVCVFFFLSHPPWEWKVAGLVVSWQRTPAICKLEFSQSEWIPDMTSFHSGGEK